MFLDTAKLLSVTDRRDFTPTSSMGSSSTSGRQGASTPIRNGVGEQLMSSMLAGNTGTNVCCQVNGYSSAKAAWPHRDNTLQGGGDRKHLVQTWIT